MKLEDRTRWLKQRSKELGFEFSGISQAKRLDEAAEKLNNWLSAGYHGDMRYMENHFEKRVDPRELVPGARSVISLMHNYTPAAVQNSHAPKLARYAYGEDYHHVLKNKLRQLMHELGEKFGEISGRCFVDSAPVMEREWAELSGLGWKGKNTLLINPTAGSYYFLAEIICDMDFVYDSPMRDHCGTCTRCIDACPTNAISPQGYILDAGKCISYLTIELREAIPEDFSSKMEDWVFGCDICQEVCPWNRFSNPHHEPAFEPKPQLMQMSREDWEEITEEVFDNLFSKSAVQRTRYEGLRRNLDFLAKGMGEK